MKFYLGIAKRFSTGSAIRMLLMQFREGDADNWMAETFPGWIYLTRHVSGDELAYLKAEPRVAPPFYVNKNVNYGA